MISEEELQEACLNRKNLIDFLEHIQEIIYTNDLVLRRQRGTELPFVPDSVEATAGKPTLLRETDELIRVLGAHNKPFAPILPKVKDLVTRINSLYPPKETQTTLGFGF